MGDWLSLDEQKYNSTPGDPDTIKTKPTFHCQMRSVYHRIRSWTDPSEGSIHCDASLTLQLFLFHAYSLSFTGTSKHFVNISIVRTGSRFVC